MCSLHGSQQAKRKLTHTTRPLLTNLRIHKWINTFMSSEPSLSSYLPKASPLNTAALGTNKWAFGGCFRSTPEHWAEIGGVGRMTFYLQA
jgi:hypothetical protein